jgi:hypothetical protein
MIAVGGLSLMLMNSSFGALVGGTQPSRRRAFILVAVLTILPTLILGTSSTNTLGDYISPLRGPMLTYFLNAPLVSMSGPTPTPINLFPNVVVLTIVIGLAESAALFGLLLLWRRWRALSN